MLVLRVAVRSLLLVCASASLPAQNQYFVDGVLGADQAANGTTPQTPWKTLHYAYAHIPAAVFPAGHTLSVAGNQSYSPATNGEQFPLTATGPHHTAVVNHDRPDRDLPPGERLPRQIARQPHQRLIVAQRRQVFRD